MKLISFQMRQALAERDGNNIIRLATEMFADPGIAEAFCPIDIAFDSAYNDTPWLLVRLELKRHTWIDGKVIQDKMNYKDRHLTCYL